MNVSSAGEQAGHPVVRQRVGDEAISEGDDADDDAVDQAGDESDSQGRPARGSPERWRIAPGSAVRSVRRSVVMVAQSDRLCSCGGMACSQLKRRTLPLGLLRSCCERWSPRGRLRATAARRVHAPRRRVRAHDRGRGRRRRGALAGDVGELGCAFARHLGHSLPRSRATSASSAPRSRATSAESGAALAGDFGEFGAALAGTSASSRPRSAPTCRPWPSFSANALSVRAHRRKPRRQAGPR